LKHLGNRSGLTLIELMVVLFILALFAALVVPNLTGQVDKAKVDTTRHQMQIFAVALDTYRLDMGSYPDSLEALITSEGDKWNGPYLRPARIPKDPWENEYVYAVTEGGSDFELSSTGNGQQEIRFGGE
jgi:general secretion pathway protein G